MTTPNQPDKNPHVPPARPQTPTPTSPSAATDSPLGPNTGVAVNPPKAPLVAKSPTAARPGVRKPSDGR